MLFLLRKLRISVHTIPGDRFRSHVAKVAKPRTASVRADSEPGHGQKRFDYHHHPRNYCTTDYRGVQGGRGRITRIASTLATLAQMSLHNCEMCPRTAPSLSSQRHKANAGFV